MTSPEEIQLHPTTEGVDEGDFRGFSEGPIKSVYTQFLDAGLRRRLVLRQDQREAIGDLRSRGPLRGADVPRFFDNPEAFLPDAIDIDLAEFSERVRGLVPVRYRSQPYISVERTKRRGWFEASPHVEVTGGDADDGDRDQSDAMGEQGQQPERMPPDESANSLSKRSRRANGTCDTVKGGWRLIQNKPAVSSGSVMTIPTSATTENA